MKNTVKASGKVLASKKEDLSSLKHLGWDKIEERVAFIKETPSGIYSGTDIEGTETIVLLTQNEGMDVWKPTHDGWYEVVSYNKAGYHEGVTYKHS